MLEKYERHNTFIHDLDTFYKSDPHLSRLNNLRHQYLFRWWEDLSLSSPGIYMLTGGRQVGKSTSCKQLIAHCIENKAFTPKHVFYLPCDEIIDTSTFSQTIRYILSMMERNKFLLIIDEVTFVPHWERVIKSLADEGYFEQGLCLLTGSDTLILKEAMMSFPGRRGNAAKTNFHLYPLSFREYVNLVAPSTHPNEMELGDLFSTFLQCGGYLRAINDLATEQVVREATLLTYEQWIRGDFIKLGKNNESLELILSALLTLGVCPTSYTNLSQKIGLVSKDTLIDYCQLLLRMDVLISLQAFDVNKKRAFPKKNRKFHFADPFITHTICQWLTREGLVSHLVPESILIEACVATHCRRYNQQTYYYKGKGEIDIITVNKAHTQAIEVKWSNQIRPHDLSSLKQFNNPLILSKHQTGKIDHIVCQPVYEYLYTLTES